MRMIAVLFILALTGVASASEWVANPDGSWTYTKSDKQLVTIPVGYHAHTTIDGKVIVHSDSNVGLPGPHEGIAHPWPKTGLAGTTVLADFVDASPQYCPRGQKCPPQGQWSSSASPGVFNFVSSSGSCPSSSGEARATGVIGRIVDRVRERRAARQSRGGLLGFGLFRCCN